MNRAGSQGFTLLEIVLVIAIIATVTVFAIPQFGGQKEEVRNTVRRIGVMSREAKRLAKLYNSTYRMVLTVAPSESSKNEEYIGQVWLEKAPGSIVLKSEKADEEKKDKTNSEEIFNLDKRIKPNPYKLANELKISKVEIASRKEPIIGGKAYIYYLPEGLVTEAAIHLQYEDNLKWTIAIQPLTGKVDIYDQEISLSEIQK